MDWNCTISEERLSDYLDGQMPPEDSVAFRAHAAGCAQCTRLLVQVQGLVGQLHKLEPLEAPPKLANNIIRATLGSPWKRWFSWAPVLWQPRFAMGALTVAASFVILFHTAGLTPAKLRKADLNPADLFRAANRQAHLTYARGAKFVNDLRVVYEIQSRLQPEPEPASAPVPSPAPEQQSQPPSSNPQQKSEQKPRDRSQLRIAGMFAYLLPESMPGSLLGDITRSSR
jgi:anti-sigma factor RsiW